MSTPAEEIEHPTENADQAAQEAMARKQGWKPEDEYSGPAGTWKPASEFLKHGERIDLRKTNERLQRQIEDMKRSFASVRTFMAEQNAAKEVQIEQLRERLLNQKADAIVAGDKAGIVAAERDLEKLNKVAAQPAPQIADPDRDPEETPEARAFKERNSDWLGVPRYEAFAAQVAPIIRARHPDLTPAEYFARIEAEVRAELAERGGKSAQRASASAVEGESERGGRKPAGKRTFDALPPEAKAAYEKQRKDFKTMGHEFSKEDYVRFYKWD